MKDRAVDEHRHAGIVLEPEGSELVAARFFEVAVLDLRRRVRNKHGCSGLLDIGLIDDRQALGEVGVVGQVAVAVADREDGRDQLELGLGRGGLDLFDVAEIVVGDAIEDLKLVVGEQNAGVSGAACPAEQRLQVVDGLVDLKVDAAIEPAIGIAGTGPARPRRRDDSARDVASRPGREARSA